MRQDAGLSEYDHGYNNANDLKNSCTKIPWSSVNCNWHLNMEYLYVPDTELKYLNKVTRPILTKLVCYDVTFKKKMMHNVFSKKVKKMKFSFKRIAISKVMEL